MISGHIYQHKQVQVLSRCSEHPQVREEAPVWTLKYRQVNLGFPAVF